MMFKCLNIFKQKTEHGRRDRTFRNFFSKSIIFKSEAREFEISVIKQKMMKKKNAYINYAKMRQNVS